MNGFRLPLLLLSLLSASCYIPHFYRISFPASAVEAVPKGVFADSSDVLVLPYWRWFKSSRNGFGPPVVVPAEKLDSFTEELAVWKGFEMIDVFGHEGGEGPSARGIVLVGSQGVAVRLDHSYVSPRTLEEKGRWFWERRVALVGPEIRAALKETLSGDGARAEILELVFGLTYGEILGDEDAFAEGRSFIDQIDANGDDVWRLVGEEAEASLD